jgi:hypothetical protein
MRFSGEVFFGSDGYADPEQVTQTDNDLINMFIESTNAAWVAGIPGSSASEDEVIFPASSAFLVLSIQQTSPGNFKVFMQQTA